MEHTHTHISLEIVFISCHHFNQMGKSKLTTWNHSHFSRIRLLLYIVKTYQTMELFLSPTNAFQWLSMMSVSFVVYTLLVCLFIYLHWIIILKHFHRDRWNVKCIVAWPKSSTIFDIWLINLNVNHAKPFNMLSNLKMKWFRNFTSWLNAQTASTYNFL